MVEGTRRIPQMNDFFVAWELLNVAKSRGSYSSRDALAYWIPLEITGVFAEEVENDLTPCKLWLLSV